MLRACLTLTLVALFACAAFAGHALNSPVATTDPGDFWVSGNADFDGTVVFDGVCTFNADAIFTLDVSVGDDLTVTDDAAIGGDLTITGDLKGARVWLAFNDEHSNHTADLWLRYGYNHCSALRGYPIPVAGSVRGYAVRYNIDSYNAGAYAVTRFYINGAKAFADSFYLDATGWHDNQDVFARDTHTFSAGDHFGVEFDVNGTLQFDVPAATLDLQIDE